MSIFFGNMFWGILIILLGLSLILKDFNINIPLFKIFFGLIIILFGIKLLIGRPHVHPTANWSRVSHSSNIGKDITMVFANGSHDLTAARFEDDEIEVTVVFGNGLIILPDDINFVFQPTAVFGSTNIPSHKDVEGRKVVVDATAVFGRLDFQFKPSTRATEEKASPSADSLSTKETNF